MNSVSIPFNPLRDSLYTPEELFGEFKLTDPASYERCADISILSYFWQMGTHPARRSGASTLEALHDNSISAAIDRFKAGFPRIVAIMGGHGMKRGDPAYIGVAHIAYELARERFLLTSGGGPGAMEATHLGAMFSKRPADALSAAIKVLGDPAIAPLPPDTGKLVEREGPNSGRIDSAVAMALHAWLAPAFAIRDSLAADERGVSLGIPTWLYGYEPTTPFATVSGKYFQNSLREDGLITIGVSGILYAEGSAGTVQEIFQDAAQNCYSSTFYPMVFLGSPRQDGKRFWEDIIPVRRLIESLLSGKPNYGQKVCFTESNEEALTFLKNQQ